MRALKFRVYDPIKKEMRALSLLGLMYADYSELTVSRTDKHTDKLMKLLNESEM